MLAEAESHHSPIGSAHDGMGLVHAAPVEHLANHRRLILAGGGGPTALVGDEIDTQHAMPAWVDGAFVTDHAGPPAPGTTDEPTGRKAAEHDNDWSARRTRPRRPGRSAAVAPPGRQDDVETQ